MIGIYPMAPLDTSFGNGGSAIFQVPGALAVAVQSDGKVVTAGDQGQLVRLTANGSIDTAFGSGGTSSGNSLLNPNPNAIAVQPDDKILVAGSSVSKNKTLATVARYSSSGSVDSSFGSGGRATADFAGGKAWDVVVAPDGSISASGTSGTTTGAQNAVVSRFNPVGRPDNSFGINGVATFDSGAGDVGWRLGLQPDGKVLIGGNVISGISSSSDLLAVRFDSAGNLDYSFGNLGGTITDIYGGGETSRGVFFQNIGTAEVPDYRILVAGMAQANGNETRAVVARYLY